MSSDRRMIHMVTLHLTKEKVIQRLSERLLSLKTEIFRIKWFGENVTQKQNQTVCNILKPIMRKARM